MKSLTRFEITFGAGAAMLTTLFLGAAISGCARDTTSGTDDSDTQVSDQDEHDRGGEDREGGEHREGSEEREGGEHREGRESGEHREGAEHREGGEREGGEHGGEGRGEQDRDGEGHAEEGEESGTELSLTDTYDNVRNGARLILAYDAQSNFFKGTVANTLERTLEQVRVEVHLSNGKELGPTIPANLERGQKRDVELKAESEDFDGWTAHPEVGRDEHGEGHGEERGEHERE